MKPSQTDYMNMTRRTRMIVPAAIMMLLTSTLVAQSVVKETEPPIALCYCFGHTAESVREELVATGRSTVSERITAEVQADNCSCEVKNPSGTCCLGDVNRAVHQIQNELQATEQLHEPVAHVEKG